MNTVYHQLPFVSREIKYIYGFGENYPSDDWNGFNENYPSVMQFVVMFYNVDKAIRYVCDHYLPQLNCEVLLNERDGKNVICYKICKMGGSTVARRFIKRVIFATHPDTCFISRIDKLRDDKTKYLNGILKWLEEIQH